MMHITPFNTALFERRRSIEESSAIHSFMFITDKSDRGIAAL